MSRRVSRRAVIGGAVAVVAGGGVTAALVAASRGGDSGEPAAPDPTTTTPASQTSEPTAASTPTVEPTFAPAPSLKPADPNSIKRVTLTPADPLPWVHAVYFKQADGSVDAYHLGPDEDQGAPQHRSMGRGEYIVALRFAQDENLGILRDREGTLGLAWDTTKLHLQGAGRGVLLFREVIEIGRGDDLVVAGTDGTVRLRVKFPSSDEFAAVSPDGNWAIAAGNDGDERVHYVVNLATGEQKEVARGNADYTEANDGTGFFLTTGRGTGERLVRGYEWDGTVANETRVDVDESPTNPGQVFLYQGGVALAARETALQAVISTGHGALRHWPAVEVVDLQRKEAVYRIRSMALTGFDYTPPRRWLSGSTAFTAHYLVRPDLGPKSGHGWGVHRMPDELYAVPVPPSDPELFAQQSSVTPSPWNTALLVSAFGTFDLRTGTWNQIVAPQGTAHVDPFSARREETVFVTPHGGHGGIGPFALLPPVLERPPFDDRMLFRVARTGGCLNLRERPSESAEIIVCLADGTEVELSQDVTTAGVDQDASTRYGEDGAGIWAFVKAGEQRGWVSIQYLDWAIGEPLKLS